MQEIKHNRNSKESVKRVYYALFWVFSAAAVLLLLHYTGIKQPEPKKIIVTDSFVVDSINTDTIVFDTVEPYIPPAAKPVKGEEALKLLDTTKRVVHKATPPVPPPIRVDSLRTDSTYTFEEIMWAIAWVESHHNDYAENGKYKGFLQISPVLVKDVNQYLEKIGDERRYTLSDRFNRSKSIEMFYLIQDRYNPERDINKAARIWRHGPYYTGTTSQSYLRKMYRYLQYGY